MVKRRRCQRLFARSLLASAGTWSSLALADVTAAEGVLVVSGLSGDVGCLPPTVADDQLRRQLSLALDEAELDPDFAIVLTSEVLSCPDIFYSPVKNDIQGIGYQREGAELYDHLPERRLQGIAFLNDWPYWNAYPEEFDSAFLHELGHRWLARVHARAGEEELDLTGRQGGHWSYFLDSGGSPLEGNAFLESLPATTATPGFPVTYSPLDLYLMGALAPEEVPPFRLLSPGEDLAPEGCNGQTLGKSSPPQTCSPLTLPGTFRTVSVEDVIAAEGPRTPAAVDAPTSYDVAFLLLTPTVSEMTLDHCSAVARRLDSLLSLFSSATEGRLRLRNAVSSRSACDQLELSTEPENVSSSLDGCQLSTAPGTPRGTFPGWLLAAFGLITWVLRQRRRPATVLGRWSTFSLRGESKSRLTAVLAGLGCAVGGRPGHPRWHGRTSLP